MQSKSIFLKLLPITLACCLLLIFTLGKPAGIKESLSKIPVNGIRAIEEVSLMGKDASLAIKAITKNKDLEFAVTDSANFTPISSTVRMLQAFRSEGEFFYVKDNVFQGLNEAVREFKLSANGKQGKALRSFALDAQGNFYLIAKNGTLKFLVTIVNPSAFNNPEVAERILAKSIPGHPFSTKKGKDNGLLVKVNPVKARQCLDFIYCYEATWIGWEKGSKKIVGAYTIKIKEHPRNSEAKPNTTVKPEPTEIPGRELTAKPSIAPSISPSIYPSLTPSKSATNVATDTPKPDKTPTAAPTALPSINPFPTKAPSVTPTISGTIPTGGRTFRIAAAGAGDFQTIKACLDAALAGDTCIVGPGIYAGPVNYGRSGSEGKNIQLIAQNQFKTDLAENQRSIITGSVSLKSFNSLIGFDIRNGGVNIAGNNSTVSDNYIHGTGDSSFWGAVQVLRSPGTEPYYKNIIIKNNFVEQITHGFQIFCSANCLIEGNRIEKLYSPVNCRPSGVCPGDVDYVRLFGDGIIFKSNFLGNSKLSEIDSDAHVDGIQSFNNGGLGGQGRDTFSNSIIENNYIKDCHQPIWWTSIVGGMLSTNVTIRNNVFHNSWGTSARIAIGGPNTDRLFVYNNVFNQAVRVTAKSYTEVVNNIFIGNYMNTDDDRFSWPQGNSIMANNIFAPGGWLTSIIRSVPAISSSNKFDVETTDAFADFYRGNFALKAGSPAINYGQDLSSKGFDYDFNSEARPTGKWDAGAYEFK